VFCLLLQGFALSLISNTLNGEMLQVTSRQSAADRALAEAVIHFSIVMQALRDYRLLQPLHCLITDAGSMAVCIHIVWHMISFMWADNLLVRLMNLILESLSLCYYYCYYKYYYC